MVYPQENNLVTRDQKTGRQLAFELRKRRAEYKAYLRPVAIKILGGSIQEAILEVKKIFKQDDMSKKIVCEMQRTILMNDETIVRKILSRLVQTNFSCIYLYLTSFD